MKTLRGVKYLRDAAGHRTAVVIDLRHNRALWEDFVDGRVALDMSGIPVAERATLDEQARILSSDR